MAVFMTNSCKFNDCGLVFHTLGELIQHIEEVHIVSDPRAIEKMESQQPGSIACSYVLRFFGDAGHQPSSSKRKVLTTSGCTSQAASVANVPPVPVLPSNVTPNSSDNGEGDAESDAESSDSWVAQQEFSAQLILSMMSSKDNEMEKPFCCPIPGCKKRYKNINGVKYHARHGHRKRPRELSTYKCFCGKSYKSQHSLLNHTNLCHVAVAAAPQTVASSSHMATDKTSVSAMSSAMVHGSSVASGNVCQPAAMNGEDGPATGKLLLLPASSLSALSAAVQSQTVSNTLGGVV